MGKVGALRGTGDEGCQWIDVTYEQDSMGGIRVTDVGEDVSMDGRFREDLKSQLVGKSFASRGELNRHLNGENTIG